MEIQILSASALETYEKWVAAHPSGTLWQSLAWKRFQEALKHTVTIYVAMEGTQWRGTAMVVADKTAFGLQTWDIPRGPLANDDETSQILITRVLQDARQAGVLHLTLSPVRSFPMPEGFSPSGRHVYPDATRILDLTLPDEKILAQMKPKGRYNIGIAQKHHIHVIQSVSADAFGELAKETASRDAFRAHNASYYGKFLQNIPKAFLLLAYSPEDAVKPIAGLVGVLWGRMGIYYYGASSYAARHHMAPYLLQWEAIRFCKEQGCTQYDLFGIAPADAKEHPWAGVSDFKAKLGGEYLEYPPEQICTLRPFVESILKMKRKLVG